MAKIHPQSNTEAELKFCVYLTPPLSKYWGSWGRWQQRASGYDHMHGEETSGGVMESGTLGQKYWLNPLNIGSFTLLHQLSQRTPAKSLSQSFDGKRTRVNEPVIRSGEKLGSPGGSIQPRWRTTTGHSVSQLGMAVFRWSPWGSGPPTQAEMSTLTSLCGQSDVGAHGGRSGAEGTDQAMLGVGKSRTFSPGS